MSSDRETVTAVLHPNVQVPNDCLKGTFLNARSLHKHFNHVKCDQSLLTTDIMCVAETRMYAVNTPCNLFSW